MRKRRTPKRLYLAAALVIALTATVVALLLPNDSPSVASEEPAPPFPSDIRADLDGDGLPDSDFTGIDPLTGRETTQSIADLTAQRDLIRDLLAPGGRTATGDSGGDDQPDDPDGTTPGSGGPGSPGAANPRTSQTMLVPNTQQWWKVITSAVPELHLNEVAYPEAALWFSATTSASTNPDITARLRTFRTLSIAFETAEDAVGYQATMGGSGSFGLWAGAFLRDTILTFVPTGIDPAKEDYADLTGTTAEALKDIRPLVGVWSIDYGLLVDHAAASADTPQFAQAFRTHMAALDYSTGTTWSGVATNPTGPWTGTLDGFDPDSVDFTAAANALNSTAVVECDQDFCLGLDPGISELPTQLGFANATDGLIGHHTVPLLPNQANATMRFALNWGTALGVLNGSLHYTVAYYPFLIGWVDANNTQTMTFTQRPDNFPG